MNFFDYFTSPILRGPTFGCFFMCIASSLMGVVVLLKKRSLVTETLSHATYPGICLGAALSALFFPQSDEWLFLPIFAGALIASFLAMQAIEWLEKKRGVTSDSALTFILALFFGVGVLFASGMQATLPKTYQSLQMYLFGQAATMGDLHILFYAGLAFAIFLFLFLSYRPLQAILYDPTYAKTLGIRTSFYEKALTLFLLISLVAAIRSVGVVLLSGMALAPAIAARQYSDRLKTVFSLSALFGALSGLLGNIGSVELSLALSSSGEKVSIPTGPMMILVGTFFALFSLLFSPKRGLFFRMIRMACFRMQRFEENILKSLWKKGALSLKGVSSMHQNGPFFLFYALFRLRRNGWVVKKGAQFQLTFDGKAKAESIVRLHRLWELYLTEELGQEVETVHRSAEEMEHILTPELEERLTKMLFNPKLDPHHQPIPEGRTL